MNKRTELIKNFLKQATTDDISGPIIAIGGAEDKTNHSKILKEFFNLSGGKNCDITIIPWASEKKDAGENYKQLFENFGAKKVFLLKEKSRDKTLDAIERSAAIFFTGGDQKRLLNVLEDLDLIHDIRTYHKSGTVVAGTSAGASILSTHMPYWDSEKEKMIYFRGLDLVKDSIIDQHFSQRNRSNRLKSGVLRFKNSTGYGIDEDTALIFDNEKKPKKIGSGDILIIEHDKIKNQHQA